MGKEFGKKAKAHIRYRLDSGEYVPGVTTIVGQLAKPALIHWAWNLGREGQDYRKYRDAAANVGTLAHYMAECDLKGEEPDLAEYSEADVDKASNAVLKFLGYRDEHVLKPLFVEKPLVSNQYRFGGTIDFYGDRDGVPTLIDLKTSKAVYPEMLLQVAAYWGLLRNKGHETRDVYVLRIGRDESEGFEEIKVGALQKRWEAFKRLLEFYHINKALP